MNIKGCHAFALVSYFFTHHFPLLLVNFLGALNKPIELNAVPNSLISATERQAFLA
jgi:hypothetical protein